MKIGLLAYHAACNFGAFLQLLSTIEYVRSHGDDPKVINWVPRDFRRDYEKRSLPQVRELYSRFQKQYFPLTTLCETAKEVAATIEQEQIEAVIIGSDAVLQHHPFRERCHFPVRRIIYIAHPTSDRMYPNCFWGEFQKYLKCPIPAAVISGSSQDSKFYYIKWKKKSQMKKSVMDFSYISVRDDWTKEMIEYLTDGERRPKVTPDPVFAFNNNAGHLIPSKELILEKYQLPEDYLLVSFKNSKSVNQEWISAFESLASERGIVCVKLPYADASAFGTLKYDVGDNISPLDWYALIKYSRGYVGNNMHPIVTSIHNGIPFFSFDNYGIKMKNGRSTNGESSKIYHILSRAGMLQYRVFISAYNYVAPLPENVLEALLTFDKAKEMVFSMQYYRLYENMMKSVYRRFDIK